MQLGKVQSFTAWAGMQLAPSKCIASAALWSRYSRKQVMKAEDWESTQQVLQQLTIQGSPLQCIPANQAFKYLGAQLTLTMDSKPYLQHLIQLIQTRGSAIARCPAKMQQKLEIERHCIMSAITYHMHTAAFSHAQLQVLDKERARVLKSILKISNSSPSDMLYARRDRLGCGLVSVVPLHAQIAAEALTSSLNDAGRLGSLARAVMAAQLRGKHASITAPEPSWAASNCHMLLRQASMAAVAGLTLRYDRNATSACFMRPI